MAAGVHGAGMGGRESEPGFLGDGKCIHVGPYHQGGAGLAGPEQPDHPMRGDAGLHLEAEAFQAFGHVPGGLGLVEARFRDPVQVPAGGNHLLP